MNSIYSAWLPRWLPRPLVALGLLLATAGAAQAQTSTLVKTADPTRPAAQARPMSATVTTYLPVGTTAQVRQQVQAAAAVATTTVTFTNTQQGWFSPQRGRNATNSNYIVGTYDGINGKGAYRNFFTFSLASLNLTDKQVVSATLSLVDGTAVVPTSTVTYTLYDVSTPAATLGTTYAAGSAGAASVFNDLGTGQSYGSFVNTAASTGRRVYTLAAPALADIAARAGQNFSLGGMLLEEQATVDNYLFGSTGASGGSDGVGQQILTLELADAQTITTGAVSSAVCAGAALSVPFAATGTFAAGSVFSAQLSDAAGSFAAPVTIGTLASTSSGTIAATVPAATAGGSGYRVRVVSSSPAVTGTDNGSAITITALPTLNMLSPITGQAGTQVTLTGTNLTDATAVRFNGTAASSFMVNSATSITAVVPATATIGNVTVTTPCGTSNGVAFTVSPPTNNALDFDNMNDYVAINSQAGVSNLATSGYTIETWVYFNALAPNVNSIVRKDGDYNLFVRGGTVEAQIWRGTILTYTNSTTLLTAGRWNHVAGTWDGTQLRVYVNGVDVTGATSSYTIAVSSPLWLGRSATFNEPLNGRLDETRLYNAALTPAQIQADMYSTTSARSANLQFYYSFDQGVAGGTNTGITTLNDQSGNGNSGTLTNFALTGTTSNWVRSFPTITGISPTTGPVGTQVTITGTNLLDATSFRFNGTAVMPFTTPTSDLTATVTVPSGATTGPVSVASATLTNYNGPTFTVPAAANISVRYQTGDFGQSTDGQVRPFFQLVNNGASAVSYSSLTVRYWLTVENFMGQLVTPIDYAKLGTSFVSARYVQLPTPRQGAFGYIEYSFAAGAGSLAAGANSGDIYGKAYKPDYTNLDENDDWSYQTSGAYATNDHVTLYQNGTLLAGTEPAAVASTTSIRVFASNQDTSPTTSYLNVTLQVGNVGNRPVNYSDLTVRYYFTRDGATSIVPQVDYAKLGASNISVRYVPLSTPLNGADGYLELGFSAALGVFYPSTNTDNIQFKIRKGDYTAFTQTNDYSFSNSSAVVEQPRVPAYLNGLRIVGTEPSQATANAARVAAGSQPASAVGATIVAAASGPLALTASPNPFGEQLILRFALPTAQSYTLAVYDGQGRLVQQLASGQAKAEQAQEVAVPTQGYATGLYFVRLTTAEGVQTLKLVKH